MDYNPIKLDFSKILIDRFAVPGIIATVITVMVVAICVFMIGKAS